MPTVKLLTLNEIPVDVPFYFVVVPSTKTRAAYILPTNVYKKCLFMAGEVGSTLTLTSREGEDTPVINVKSQEISLRRGEKVVILLDNDTV